MVVNTIEKMKDKGENMQGEILFENNILMVKGCFYNGLWFQKFGKIQYEILECYNTTISIDMGECVFISPTPFLSLLLTLYRSKEERQCLIKIDFGNSNSDEKRKFLNYCAKEGFLDIINMISGIKYDTSLFESYMVVVRWGCLYR